MVLKVFCLMAMLLAAEAVQASDLKLQAQLIWGTNDEKSPNPEHKPVDPVLAKKLGKIFKWKNYFEVNRQNAMIPSRQSRKLTMSKRCVIEVQELEGPRVEVRLFGDGKLVNKTVEALTPGGLLTVAGPDKNENAWFIVLQAEENNPETKK
jgi:hypothetical protein